MAGEGNPNHSVVQMMEQQWYKICALLMFEKGITEFEVTAELMDRMQRSGLCNVVADARNKKLVIRLVSDAEATKLSRKEGGRSF